MLVSRFKEFLGDESGAYTIWSLIWFSLYVCIGGLAVDITDAYRTRTQLQSTADASALAGVMSLPDEGAAVTHALAYSAQNMDPSIDDNQDVLTVDQVFVGNWDGFGFTNGGSPANAVRVITRRADTNGNALATNFLRIIGLDRFNVVSEAVATRFVPGCLTNFNALVAGNKVDVTSNNTFLDTCMHGQNMIEDSGHNYAVEIQNNGTIGEGVEVSMSDLNDMIDRPTICSNDGLCEPGVVVEGDMMPSDAFLVGDAILAMQGPSAADYLPEELYVVDLDKEQILPPASVHIDLSNCDACDKVQAPMEFDPVTGLPLPPNPNGSDTYEYVEVMEPNTVYVFSCDDPMDQLVLPDPDLQPVLQQVAVISECRIMGHADMELVSVTLASSAVGEGAKPYDKATIQFPADVKFGADDDCAPGGGVQIYSAASVRISASAEINELRIVARGDVELTANEEADGINIQAGEDIRFTANANIGTRCSGTMQGAFAAHYRLVR